MLGGGQSCSYSKAKRWQEGDWTARGQAGNKGLFVAEYQFVPGPYEGESPPLRAALFPGPNPPLQYFEDPPPPGMGSHKCLENTWLVRIPCTARQTNFATLMRKPPSPRPATPRYRLRTAGPSCRASLRWRNVVPSSSFSLLETVTAWKGGEGLLGEVDHPRPPPTMGFSGFPFSHSGHF